MFAYCGNNPINRIDPSGEDWYHWVIGAGIVAACAVATVLTCGTSIAAAATAVGLVGNGVAASTTASTVAAAAFIGSGTALGTAVLFASSNSNSVDEFYAQGNWGTVAATAGGAILGGYEGYSISKTQTPQVPLTTKPTRNSANINYPGNDPTKCDVPGFEWRGSGPVESGRGNFVNMQTG